MRKGGEEKKKNFNRNRTRNDTDDNNKDIKTIIITIFHMLKKAEKKLRMFKQRQKILKRSKTII